MATHADEEADAWMEYLRACRDAKLKSGRYDDLESWEWARLRARLHALELRQTQRERVAV
jgi:hypothetical protein